MYLSLMEEHQHVEEHMLFQVLGCLLVCKTLKNGRLRSVFFYCTACQVCADLQPRAQLWVPCWSSAYHPPHPRSFPTLNLHPWLSHFDTWKFHQKLPSFAQKTTQVATLAMAKTSVPRRWWLVIFHTWCAHKIINRERKSHLLQRNNVYDQSRRFPQTYNPSEAGKEGKATM